MICPICKNKTQENPAFPFCSERCKQIDLGRWVMESYRISPEEEDAEALEDNDTPPLSPS